MQRQERRVAGVEGVGVGAIGGQHQLAIGTVDGLRGDRSNTGSGRHAVGALGVVAQYVTAEDGLYFAGGSGVTVVHCRRHIVDDVYVQRIAGGSAVAVGDRDAERFAEAVGAAGGRVVFVVVEGVAVAHQPARRVVAGDGQGVAQAGGDGLREAGVHAIGDHVDPTDAQGLHTVQRRDGEGAALGQ